MAMYPCLSLPSLSFPTLTDSIVTFNSQYAGLPLKSHTVEVVASQSGSGTPSPDNVRTINGWSAIHIQNTCGINQWDEQYLEGYYNSSGVFTSQTGQLCTKNKIAVIPNTEYYLGSSINLIPSNTAICYYDNGGAIISRQFVGKGTFTTPNNCYYINVNFGSIYGGTYLHDLCINYPSTDTSYHAFVGQSITIQIGSTVYGGTYNAITGILSVTHEIVEMSSISYNAGFGGYYTGYYANTIKSPDTSANSDLMCSCFAVGDTIGGDNMFIQPIGSSYSGYIIILPSATYQDSNAFRNSLQGQYLVYPLKTPTTLQLPPCPIETLLENNIWADTGDTTLQYPKFG